MIVQIVPDYQAKRPIFLVIHNSVINQHREFIYNPGKFLFTSFWATFLRRNLCRLDWPVTGYTGQENLKFLFHSLQHLENWDCRHVPSWLCLVETIVLCILGIQYISWVSVVGHLPPNWSLNSRRENEVLTRLMKNPKSTCLEKMKFVRFGRTSPLGNRSGTQLLTEKESSV